MKGVVLIPSTALRSFSAACKATETKVSKSQKIASDVKVEINYKSADHLLKLGGYLKTLTETEIAEILEETPKAEATVKPVKK